MTDRYFLATDNSGHWYVVPVARADEWRAWANLAEDDERADDAPDFAEPVNGSPGRVTFTDPRVGS